MRSLWAARPEVGTVAGLGPVRPAAHLGRLMVVLAVIWLACLVLPAPVLAVQEVPALSGRVVDLTGTLDTAQHAALEAQLEAIEKAAGSQVAVLLVPGTEPETIEAYAIRVVEQWQLGRAGVDDGVLVLVALRERRMRIEVGYGLEGAIPDALARRIVAERMTPRFREGDFAGGLSAAVEAIGRAIAGEPLPPPAPRTLVQEEETDWLALLLFAAFIGFVLTRMMGLLPGAMASGVGGGVLAALAGASLPIAVAAGLVLFFMLLLTGAVGPLGRTGERTWRSSSPPIIFPHDRNGSFGGGGFRGGRSGGGGFGGGGFRGGGGGFGGGGASGGW